jgi:hypothetical protein
MAALDAESSCDDLPTGIDDSGPPSLHGTDDSLADNQSFSDLGKQAIEEAIHFAQEATQRQSTEPPESSPVLATASGAQSRLCLMFSSS